MSPQYDQKVTKTQKEVTVDPYFWSAIDYHPVYNMYIALYKFPSKSSLKLSLGWIPPKYSLIFHVLKVILSVI